MTPTFLAPSLSASMPPVALPAKAQAAGSRPISADALFHGSGSTAPT